MGAASASGEETEEGVDERVCVLRERAWGAEGGVAAVTAALVGRVGEGAEGIGEEEAMGVGSGLLSLKAYSEVVLE